MGSLAIIARQKGFKVTGCDQDAYPPMSNLLKKNNIEVIKGWSKTSKFETRYIYNWKLS